MHTDLSHNSWADIWVVARGIHSDLRQNPCLRENKAKWHRYSGSAQNPNTFKAEAEESGVQGQPGQQLTLPQINQPTNQHTNRKGWDLTEGRINKWLVGTLEMQDTI